MCDCVLHFVHDQHVLHENQTFDFIARKFLQDETSNALLELWIFRSNRHIEG